MMVGQGMEGSADFLHMLHRTCFAPSNYVKAMHCGHIRFFSPFFPSAGKFLSGIRNKGKVQINKSSVHMISLWPSKSLHWHLNQALSKGQRKQKNTLISDSSHPKFRIGRLVAESPSTYYGLQISSCRLKASLD